MKEQIMDNLYKHKEVPVPTGCIKLSPSQLAKFFNYPSVWFRENILNEPSEFIGNESSLIGTSCHYLYEQVANKAKIVSRNFINTHLLDYITNIVPDLQYKVDYSTIISKYPDIFTVVYEEYLKHNIPTYAELSVCQPVKGYDNIYIAGTADAVLDETLIDYKTVSTKPTDTAPIPFEYKTQLMAYVYALKHQYNIEINRIRIVYGVHATKTIGPRCIVKTEELSKQDFDDFNDMLELICGSIQLAKKDNSLIPYLFKSMNLKGIVI